MKIYAGSVGAVCRFMRVLRGHYMQVAASVWVTMAAAKE